MPSPIEELSDDLRKLLKAAEDLLQDTSGAAGQQLDQAGEEARATVNRVCGHLRSARDEVSGRARKLDSAIHAHPWQALVGTAIVAFIAGLAMRRR